MTGKPEWNFREFDAAAEWLAQLGIKNYVSPAEEDRRRGFDPIENPYAEPSKEFIAESIRLDLDIITTRARSLLMLPGWEESTGARAEYHLARWLGLDVYEYPSGEKIPADHHPWKPTPFETKETNPKDPIGASKTPASFLPPQVLWEAGLSMMDGACKYGAFNWREAAVRASVYFDAARRHLDSWFEGEDEDPDSGENHIVKAITSLIVLRDAMIMDKWNDDRPPKGKAGYLAECNLRAARILKKYPSPKERFTERRGQV